MHRAGVVLLAGTDAPPEAEYQKLFKDVCRESDEEAMRRAIEAAKAGGGLTKWLVGLLGFEPRTKGFTFPEGFPPARTISSPAVTNYW